MIDIAAFLAERERLRQFCFTRTRATIVIRDVRDPAGRPRPGLGRL